MGKRATRRNRVETLLGERTELVRRAKEIDTEVEVLRQQCSHDWRVVGQMKVGDGSIKRYRCSVCHMVENRPI